MGNNIAIIPARSGSKGLKDKNIKLLQGKPLIAYSIEAALQSRLFDEIIVSTDSEEYAEIARKYGASVPFLRSAENSSDVASSWDVVREILEKYEKLDKFFDTVCLLQPTSPLRTVEDIIKAYTLFEQKKANSIIGVCEMEHSPLWSNVLPETLSMEQFVSPQNSVQRQQLETYYRINGAMYIVNAECVKENINIYRNSFAYVMDKEKSVDIDTELDFLLAETILKHIEECK